MIETKQQKTGMCKFHNVRFYNLTPRAINASSYNKETNLLAITRENASIEIWNWQHAPYMQQSIPGSVDSSVEALGWVNNRLFSTGLTGELIEWDLTTLEAQRKLLLTGNAAWCLDVNKQNTNIAVGTESGFINIFDVSNPNEVNYVKIFDKQDGRILCCKFDYSGDFVVTGSADTIRIWELKTGHAIYKMNVSRIEAKHETTIWSLSVLRNFTIIAGDSRGFISIWDGKTASQIDNFQAMKSGDVLALAVSEDEKIFACAGIDPKIKIFAISEMKKGEKIIQKWVKFLQRCVHEHDVKTLQFVGSRIISGSVDGYIGYSSATKERNAQGINKFGPFLAQPCSAVSHDQRVVLLKYEDYLELWRLGKPTENIKLVDNDNDKRKYYILEKNFQKLLQLKAKNGSALISSTISPNGEFLLYSTNECIRLFQINYGDEKLDNLTRVDSLPDQFTPSTKCIFSPNSQSIYLVKNNRTIDIFQISNNGVLDINYVETIYADKYFKGAITHILLSNCGTYLVCAGTCGKIAAWKFTGKIWKHHINLPKYPIAPSAIAINKNSPKIVVSFPDSKIFEYHLEELKFLCSSNRIFVNNQEFYNTRGIILDPNNENVIILYNETQIISLKKKFENNEQQTIKKSKNDKTNNDSDVADLVCIKNSPYDHLVELNWMGDNELIAVSVNPDTLIEQLPPAFKEKRFGIS